MTILFLDFDGVLHPEHIPGESSDSDPAHFSCLSRLEALLREFPGIEVVISSSWRVGRSLADLRAWFSQDLQPRIIGSTPVLPKSAGHRQREIESWLQENNHAGFPWLAVDDWPPLFDQDCDKVFFTETVTGLDEEGAMHLRKRLLAMAAQI